MEPRTSPEVGGMGHSLKRKEDPRFIRGKGTYVDDVQLPGMLYLDIVCSPYAHAKIVKIDSAPESEWIVFEFSLFIAILKLVESLLQTLALFFFQFCCNF